MQEIIFNIEQRCICVLFGYKFVETKESENGSLSWEV